MSCTCPRCNTNIWFVTFRDLRMLLKSAPTTSRSRHPVVMPRPSSRCYIFEMETIRLICFSEKCLILTPEDKNTQAFIKSLKAQFRLSATNFIRKMSGCQYQFPVLLLKHHLTLNKLLLGNYKGSPSWLLRINDDTTMKLLHQKSVQYQGSYLNILNLIMQKVCSV